MAEQWNDDVEKRLRESVDGYREGDTVDDQLLPCADVAAALAELDARAKEIEQIKEGRETWHTAWRTEIDKLLTERNQARAALAELDRRGAEIERLRGERDFFKRKMEERAMAMPDAEEILRLRASLASVSGALAAARATRGKPTIPLNQQDAPPAAQEPRWMGDAQLSSWWTCSKCGAVHSGWSKLEHERSCWRAPAPRAEASELVEAIERLSQWTSARLYSASSDECSQVMRDIFAVVAAHHAREKEHVHSETKAPPAADTVDGGFDSRLRNDSAESTPGPGVSGAGHSHPAARAEASEMGAIEAAMMVACAAMEQRMRDPSLSPEAIEAYRHAQQVLRASHRAREKEHENKKAKANE